MLLLLLLLRVSDSADRPSLKERRAGKEMRADIRQSNKTTSSKAQPEDGRLQTLVYRLKSSLSQQSPHINALLFIPLLLKAEG